MPKFRNSADFLAIAAEAGRAAFRDSHDITPPTRNMTICSARLANSAAVSRISDDERRRALT